MLKEQKQWFQLAFQVRGSVIPSVIGRTTICGLFGVLVSVLFAYRLPVSLPVLASLIPNIVLGLLLVFRTNTAYDRFWEGRKAWGLLVNTVRNLARQLWITIPVQNQAEHDQKVATARLLVAFGVAVKLHLRQEPVSDELAELVSPDQLQKLQQMNHPPLEIAFWIGDYLQQQHERGLLNAYQLNAMFELLNDMVDALGICERILRTPMPLAYAIHLKQLLLLYCLSLPFQMVRELGSWTGPVVALISFTLFGIEEIGLEIENPFGRDPNDLPLDAICDVMRRNLEDLISLRPSSETYNNPAVDNYPAFRTK
jgi:putative membrane protein